MSVKYALKNKNSKIYKTRPLIKYETTCFPSPLQTLGQLMLFWRLISYRNQNLSFKFVFHFRVPRLLIVQKKLRIHALQMQDFLRFIFCLPRLFVFKFFFVLFFPLLFHFILLECFERWCFSPML